MYRDYPAFNPDICHLSHKNCHRFGYGGADFNYRRVEDDQFHVTFAPVSRPIGSFHDECINAVKLIRDATTEKLVVLLSGGVDSELIAMSLLEAGIPFETATLRFNDDLNMHDIKYAFDFVKAHNLKHTVFDLDIDKFFEQTAYDYADMTYCVSPIMLPTMWLIDQVDGYIMMCASNPIILKNIRIDPWSLDKQQRSYRWEWFSPHQSYDDQWYHVESERLYAWDRYFMTKNRSACTSFFKHTPELLAASFLDRMTNHLINDRSIEKFSNLNLKLPLYQKHFPTLVGRPKYHGFENIFTSVDNPCRERLMRLYPGANAFVWTRCSDFLRELNVRFS